MSFYPRTASLFCENYFLIFELTMELFQIYIPDARKCYCLLIIDVYTFTDLEFIARRWG